jgi:4-amino-4-deoxy-L-arabinose transferase-like glycosyltransferase
MACGAVLAWYNYARFDSPFQFGTAYQLTGSRVSRVMLHPRHILPSLYFYLFSPPLWIRQFPFLQLMRQAPTPFGHREWMPWINLEEEFAGILSIAPLCLAGMLLPLAMFRRAAASLGGGVRWMILAISGAAVAMLLGIAFAGSISMRYHVDYAPELLICALFVCVWLAETAGRRWLKNAILTVTVCAAGWGTLCSMALSVNGYGHSLRTGNPALFQKLTEITGGDPNAIRYPVRQLQFEASLRFGAESPGVREALVSAGAPEGGDLLMVEYTGGGRLRFIERHPGDTDVIGPEISCDPAVAHQFSYDYARTDYGRLTVRLDGQRVLFRQGEMHFTAPGDFATGQDRTGTGTPPFSGKIEIQGGVKLVFGE